MEFERWFGAGVYDPDIGFIVAGGLTPKVERSYDGITFEMLSSIPTPFSSRFNNICPRPLLGFMILPQNIIPDVILFIGSTVDSCYMVLGYMVKSVIW